MKIQIKKHLENSKLKVDFNQFKILISNNQIGPSDLIKDNIITKSKWMTADNLKIFHRLSPEHNEYGQLLKEQLADEERKKQSEKETMEKLHQGYQRAVEFFQIGNIKQSDIGGQFDLYMHYQHFQELKVTPGKDNIYISVINSFEPSEFYQLKLRTKEVLKNNCLCSIHDREINNILEIAQNIPNGDMEYAEDILGLDGYSLLFLSFLEEIRGFIRWSPSYNSKERKISCLNKLHMKLKLLTCRSM